MKKVTLLILVLVTLALAVVTSVPAAQAKGGGVCFWTCDCTGTPVCTCPPGTTGFCIYPPNIGCPQVYTC